VVSLDTVFGYQSRLLGQSSWAGSESIRQGCSNADSCVELERMRRETREAVMSFSAVIGEGVYCGGRQSSASLLVASTN
jgi:hypothetical protein